MPGLDADGSGLRSHSGCFEDSARLVEELPTFGYPTQPRGPDITTVDARERDFAIRDAKFELATVALRVVVHRRVRHRWRLFGSAGILACLRLGFCLHGDTGRASADGCRRCHGLRSADIDERQRDERQHRA
ncbi:MAG: hypothetical protein LW806_12530 [Planctomycetaceae bacterium]|nr:hypothetical protein [Planctomycetaceae bacterium]